MSAATIAAKVWAYPTRSTVSGSPASPTTEQERIAEMLWAESSRTLTSAFVTGYTKRKPLLYGSVLPMDDLTGFPKLFTITADSDINAELSSGNGITVTAADGTTEVPFGLYPSSDPAAGTLLMRAKFDLDRTAIEGELLGYLYYSASRTTTEDKAGVVSNGYLVFMPMEDSVGGGTIYDWATETSRGTLSGSSFTSETGLVGKRIRADLTTDYAYITGNVLSGLSSFTIETIANFENPTGSFNNNAPFSYNDAGSGDTVSLAYDNADPPTLAFSKSESFASDSAVGNSALSAATNYHLVGRCDAGTLNFLVNGTVQTDTGFKAGAVSGASDTKFLGASNQFGKDFAQEELRISNVARSNAWLGFAYNDDFSNTSTFSLGAEETGGLTTTQFGYRFFNDDGSESGSTAKAAMNTPVAIAKNSPVRPRIGLDVAGDLASLGGTLRYRKLGDTNWITVK